MTHADVLSIFSGALTTLLLSMAGIALGLPLGLGLALARWAKVPLLNQVVAVYVSLLRATPLITLVLLIFFALPTAGVSVGPVTAGLIALVLNTAAFSPGSVRGSAVGLTVITNEATNANTPTTKIVISALPTSRNGTRSGWTESSGTVGRSAS